MRAREAARAANARAGSVRPARTNGALGVKVAYLRPTALLSFPLFVFLSHRW